MAFSAVLTGTGQNCTLTSGQPNITVTSATGLVVGATIQGTGIPTGTRIGTISGTTIGMVNASGVAVNATAGGTQSLIFSSVYGSTLTISMSASTDTATPQDIYNAGFGVMSENIAKREIFFAGGLTVVWANIVSGAVFDFGNWTLEFGVGGRWLFQESSIVGELRGGYLVNGTQFIKTAGPTFYSNNWNNNGAGGSSMFQNVSGTTNQGLFRMHNPRFVQIAGSNASFTFNSARMTMTVENMILDYQTDSAGANAGIGAAFGTLKNTYLVKTNAGIGQTNGTNYATFDGIQYVGNYQSVPEHKFSLPNGYTLDGYSPQVLSTQFLGGFNSATSEIYSNINLSTAGWGLNDLKTKYQRYGGPITLQFPRTVAFQFNDSVGTDLTNVTLFIKSGSTTLVNAIQSGDYSANTQALNLVWSANVASYRLCNSFVDTIAQTAQFRKNGYISQSVSYSLNTAAYSQPIFMLTDPAYGSVTPTQAAALTGIALDFTNKLITGSNAKNLDELYAFGQYSLALTANSTQADFQTSNGGVYNLLNTWKLYWTAGALTMGTYNKTFNSSTQWKFGNTASLTLDKDDVTWTPAARADLFQFENGSTFNVTNGSTFTISPTATLGYGGATTSEFRSGSILNMSDSTVIYNIVSGGSGTVFSNSEAGATWNISNSTLTLNCPNGAQVAIHAYFLPASTINNFTVNGTATNVIWQMGYLTNNSKMVGFKYGGAIFGNGTSNVLMDTYTYTGSLSTIPNTFGSNNKWYWVDPVMNAGGLFRWNAGSTPTGSSGFYGVIGFRPTITMDKTGYAPKVRFTPSTLATRYPSFQVQSTAFGTLPLTQFFKDPTFMTSTDGYLPFVDSLDDKTVINTIDWTVNARQAGFIDQIVTFTAATAKKGLITSTFSGAVDSNYVNATTALADSALITVNTTTKTIAPVSGNLSWSPQRLYNALKNWWATYASNTDFLAATGGGYLDLGDYNTSSTLKFQAGNSNDALTSVRTTGLINAPINDIPVTDARGSSTILTLSGFGANSAVYVEDNAGVQKYFNADVTGSVVVYIPPTATGSWYYAVEKFGNQRQSDFFTFSGGQKSIVVKELPDNKILLSKAQITALTSVDNPDEAYDAIALLRTGVPYISFGQILSKDGATLYGADYSILIKSNATNVADVDYDNKLITLKSALFEAGPVCNLVKVDVPKTVTANATEVINVNIEDNNGDSTTEIKGVSGSLVDVWKCTNGTLNVDYATGTKIAENIGAGKYRFIHQDGFKLIFFDKDTLMARDCSMSKGTYTLGWYVYNNSQGGLDQNQSDKFETIFSKVDVIDDNVVSVKGTVEGLSASTGVTEAEIIAMGLAKEATSEAIKTKVEAIQTSDADVLLPTIYAIQNQQNNIAQDQNDILAAIQSANNNFDPVTDSLSAISDAIDVLKTLVEDKTGYSLTTNQVEAIAVAVEAHLLDEGDSQQLINAIVGAIGNANIDETALVAAIRSDIERADGMLKAVKTKVDTLNNADFTDTNALIVDLGSPLQAEDYVAPDNAKIVQIKTKVDTLENADFTATNDKIDAVKTKVDALNNADFTATNAKIDAVKTKVDTLENADFTTTNDKIDALAEASGETTPATIKAEIKPMLDKLNEGLQRVSNFEPYEDDLPN